jgi:hypothetical protein
MAIHVYYKKKLTGRGGPYGYETSRFPHFLDNRFTDGGEVVSHTRRPPFTPQEDSWYSFLLQCLQVRNTSSSVGLRTQCIAF